MTDNNYFVIKAKRKASSLSRFRVRVKWDTCLHNDIENFMTKHDSSLSRLVDMLLDNDFALARYTDPTYPIKH